HPPTLEIHTLSLHDALPISSAAIGCERRQRWQNLTTEITLNGQRPRMPLTSMKKTPQQGEIGVVNFDPTRGAEIKKPRPALVVRSEEHTSELQSRENLVCRL